MAAAEEYDKIGGQIALPYDPSTGTHLQYSGFRLDLMHKLLKQPDVLMLQYPLQYKMEK